MGQALNPDNTLLLPLGIESSTSDWLSGDVEEQSARIQQAIESENKIFALGSMMRFDLLPPLNFSRI